MDGDLQHFIGVIHQKIPKGKQNKTKCKLAKWLSEQAYQELRKKEKQKTREKGKDIPN